MLLRLQIRHYRTSLQPLPLLTWYDGPQGRTHTAWSCLGGRPVVFWARHLDARVLVQLLRTNGQLALAGPEEASPQAMDHYLRQLPPMAMLHRLGRLARPWPQVVGPWLKDQADGTLRELLSQLQRRQANLELLLQALPRAERKRLQALQCSPSIIRMARYGDRQLEERPDGWYEVARRPRGATYRLTNFLFRIDAISSPSTGLRYAGRILFEGQAYPFAVSARTLERSPGSWLLRFFVEHIQALPEHATRGLSLVKLACAFQQPALAMPTAAHAACTESAP